MYLLLGHAKPSSRPCPRYQKITFSDVSPFMSPSFALKWRSGFVPSLGTFILAVDELIKLRILIEIQPEDDALSRLQMNNYFRRGFQYALCNPIEPWHNTSASQMLKEDKIAPTKEELDEHCYEKWNDVLRVILNVQSPTTTSDSTIENFLKCTGLVLENSKRSHEITSDGYEYLLKDHQSQVRS